MINISHKSYLNHDEFLEISNAINSCSIIKELFDIFPNNLDLKIGSYHQIPAAGDFAFKSLKRFYGYNIPDNIEKYLNQDVKISNDPGLFATFSKGLFIWLSDMVDNPIVIDQNHDAFVREALKIVGDGLLIPLYGPKNKKGYAFMSFGRGKSEFDEIMPFQIQALAQMLHIRYCLLSSKLQRAIKLTNREYEVLELITFGKTNPEIAQILEISPNTVSGYVKIVFLKLDVNDRVTAALRAQFLDLKI